MCFLLLNLKSQSDMKMNAEFLANVKSLKEWYYISNLETNELVESY
jgi:hypothetical protein